MTGKGVPPAAIGIDLGARHSCVGVWHQDKVEIITNEQGNRTTPSFVAFTSAGCLVGEGAMNQATRNPSNTIYDLQRLVGRRFNDPEVQENIKSWPFKVIKGSYGLPKIAVEYKDTQKEFFADEISALILVELKNLAEAYLGTTLKDVVITVPAYFNDSQCQATKVAAHLAGLDVLQLISEPVSAITAYGLHMKNDDTNVLIFDLDYDTLDVSLVTINEKGKLTMKATGSDTHFGDHDIVNMVVDYCVKEFKRTYKIDLSSNLRALGRLRYHSEKAILDLTLLTEATVDVDCLHGGIDYFTIITRNKFEYIISSFLNKCIEAVESCLSDAKINKTDVDHVVLGGGLTNRIPKVKQLLQEFFSGSKLHNSIHGVEVVAYGAAIIARNLSREKNEKAKNVLPPLLNVVPLSLGVDAHDGVFSVIIPRNTPMPAQKENIYFTTKDNQNTISFNVYQGERSKAKDNNWLGEFEVAVSLAPKGKSKVKLLFSVDSDGTLNCWVKEFTTGLKKKIMIDNYNKKLSEEEIENMVNDAERFKFQDQEYKKIMCTRNILEDYIYNVKRKMKTIGSTDKTMLHADEIKKMENAIEIANEYVVGNHELADVDEYQKVLNELEKLCVGVIAQLIVQ